MEPKHYKYTFIDLISIVNLIEDEIYYDMN